jgi:hypothetical protein
MNNRRGKFSFLKMTIRENKPFQDPTLGKIQIVIFTGKSEQRKRRIAKNKNVLFGKV